MTSNLRAAIFAAGFLGLPLGSPPRAQTVTLADLPVDRFDGEKLTFDDAVGRALFRNPTVVVAKNELIRSRALLEQVRAASLPTLTANGSQIRYDHNRVINNVNAVTGVTTQNIIQNENETAANLMLSLPSTRGTT